MTWGSEEYHSMANVLRAAGSLDNISEWAFKFWNRREVGPLIRSGNWLPKEVSMVYHHIFFRSPDRKTLVHWVVRIFSGYFAFLHT